MRAGQEIAVICESLRLWKLLERRERSMQRGRHWSRSISILTRGDGMEKRLPKSPLPKQRIYPHWRTVLLFIFPSLTLVATIRRISSKKSRRSKTEVIRYSLLAYNKWLLCAYHSTYTVSIILSLTTSCLLHRSEHGRFDYDPNWRHGGGPSGFE